MNDLTLNELDNLESHVLPFIPIRADNATFFTPSSYTFSVKEAGPNTLSEKEHKIKLFCVCSIIILVTGSSLVSYQM